MNDKMEEFYWYWLCNIAGIGREKIRRLLMCFESAGAVYDADEAQLKEVEGLRRTDVEHICQSRYDGTMYLDFKRLEQREIRFTHIGQPDYPRRLLEIPDRPICLYYKGRLPSEECPSVAIIGARSCSGYGSAVARQMGYELAKAGTQVISGLAMGIDTCGHQGTVNASGATFAVLGCGVDICYPRNNMELYMNIQQCGGILSEYTPGTPGRAGNFPVRNRIISGLSDVVVVVEARKKSGSLITVDQALEQGREVMAVPGRAGDLLSEGTNHLLKLGAQVATCAGDVLEVLQELPVCRNFKTMVKTENNMKNDIVLASTEKMVYGNICFVPKNINTIIEETGLDSGTITKAILNLELINYIEETAKNYYVRCV